MWLSAFAFLAMLGFTGLAAAVALVGALRHHPRLARLGGVAAGAVLALYGIVLVGAGLATPARELGPGEEKHICEIDCHLACAVLATARPTVTAYEVSLRMRFDPETISTRRGNAPLTPGRRRIRLIDSEGREYRPVQTSGLDTVLRPGESAEARLVFEVPANAWPVRLRLEDADPLKRLLIGSETAPLHDRIVFRLS